MTSVLVTGCRDGSLAMDISKFLLSVGCTTSCIPRPSDGESLSHESYQTLVKKLLEDCDVVVFLAHDGYLKRSDGPALDLLKFILVNSGAPIVFVATNLDYGVFSNVISSSHLSACLRYSYTRSKFILRQYLMSCSLERPIIFLPASESEGVGFLLKSIFYKYFSSILGFEGISLETFNKGAFYKHLLAIIQTPCDYGLVEISGRELNFLPEQSSICYKDAGPFFRFLYHFRKFAVLHSTADYSVLRTAALKNDITRYNSPTSQSSSLITIISPVLLCDENFLLTLKNIGVVQHVVAWRWIIVTPRKSFDKILKAVSSVKVDCEVIIDSGNGIYSAYNQAVSALQTNYYIPLSAGDILCIQGVVSLSHFVATTPSELVFFQVFKHDNIRTLVSQPLFNYATHCFATGHSASCVIDKRLHDKFGLYDESYKLAADSKFFELVKRNSPTSISYLDKVVGIFAPHGASQRHRSLALDEHLRLRLEVGSNRFYEYFLRVFRQIIDSFRSLIS